MTAAGTIWVRALTAIAATALAGTAVLSSGPLVATAEAAGSSLSLFDARLVADINRARANHGLPALSVANGTTDIAHSWSCHLAANRLLAHNLRLATQLATHGSSLWTYYAENVGYISADSGAWVLFRSYMNSPAHRANILSRSARYIGVWSKAANGVRYNTIDFVGAGRYAYQSSYGSMRVTC